MRGVLFLVFGAVGLFVGGAMLRSSLRLRGWPSTTGQIAERSVVRRADVGQRTAQFEPTVRYHYTVGGRAYVGTRIRPGTAVETKDAAQAELDALPAEVSVRYNPDNPAEAYLQGDPWTIAAMALGVGAVLALLGAAMLIARA